MFSMFILKYWQFLVRNYSHIANIILQHNTLVKSS